MFLKIFFILFLDEKRTFPDIDNKGKTEYVQFPSLSVFEFLNIT